MWKFWDYRAHLVIRSSYEKAWVDEPVIQGSTIKGTVEIEAPKPDEPTSFHQPYPGRFGYRPAYRCRRNTWIWTIHRGLGNRGPRWREQGVEK